MPLPDRTTGSGVTGDVGPGGARLAPGSLAGGTPALAILRGFGQSHDRFRCSGVRDHVVRGRNA